MPIEIWKPVEGFPRYQISNMGRVRGVKTFMLTPDSVKGYKRVKLVDRRKTRRAFVHTLVLENFVGPFPDNTECNHIDGDPANNRVENLEFATKSENQIHAYAVLGKQHQTGSKHGMHKLTESDVLAIRARKGDPQASIAADFGVSVPTVSMILKRRTWRHI